MAWREPVEAARQQIDSLVEHSNQQRYHESLQNLTLADGYFGRVQAILK